MKKFTVCCLLFVTLLSWLDRRFLKGNDGFCIRNIHGSAPFDLPSASALLPTDWENISKQSFHYLKRGHQSYVFASEDGNYVIKFYRFPSELRPFPLFSHHFSNLFGKKRTEIKAYNVKKLEESFESFQIANELLRDETRVVMVHLKPTRTLKKTISLYDRLQMRYEVDLDRVVFLVQRRAELIFPHLENLLDRGRTEELRSHIKDIVHLITSSCKKEVANLDALLEKNYGFLGDKAIHIDVGRFVREEGVKMRAKQEVEKITAPLRSWLQAKDPSLVEEYERLLHDL